jgi:hypothetical protein
LAKPAVPDPMTAKAIFLAVEKALGFSSEQRHFPLVTVVDEGDHWTVLRDAPLAVSHTPGVVIVSAGGGQLGMDIAKCDGAVSDAALNK